MERPEVFQSAKIKRIVFLLIEKKNLNYFFTTCLQMKKVTRKISFQRQFGGRTEVWKTLENFH